MSSIFTLKSQILSFCVLFLFWAKEVSTRKRFWVLSLLSFLLSTFYWVLSKAEYWLYNLHWYWCLYLIHSLKIYIFYCPPHIYINVHSSLLIVLMITKVPFALLLLKCYSVVQWVFRLEPHFAMHCKIMAAPWECFYLTKRDRWIRQAYGMRSW